MSIIKSCGHRALRLMTQPNKYTTVVGGIQDAAVGQASEGSASRDKVADDHDRRSLTTKDCRRLSAPARERNHQNGRRLNEPRIPTKSPNLNVVRATQQRSDISSRDGDVCMAISE